MANQVWQITAPGKLTLVDLGPTLPQPGPGQALVRVEAVSLNYRDVLVAAHSPAYPLLAKPGLVPCSDAAGIVEAVGAHSTWAPGTHVIVHPNTWLHGARARDFRFDAAMGAGHVDGTLRRWLLLDDARLIAAPPGYGAAELATFYTAGVTAWRALRYGTVAKLEPGTAVLTMGTGGVSCYAIMIAAACGATVVATSSSDEKLQTAKALGATHLVNYRTHPDWAAKVLEATGGEGVDIAVDVVGAQSIEETLRATRQGGCVSHVGVLGENPAQPVNVMPALLFGAKTIQAFLGAGSKEVAEEFVAFAKEHKLRPPIAHVFDFEAADKALDALTSQQALGKIVVKL